MGSGMAERSVKWEMWRRAESMVRESNDGGNIDQTETDRRRQANKGRIFLWLVVVLSC